MSVNSGRGDNARMEDILQLGRRVRRPQLPLYNQNSILHMSHSVHHDAPATDRHRLYSPDKRHRRNGIDRSGLARGNGRPATVAAAAGQRKPRTRTRTRQTWLNMVSDYAESNAAVSGRPRLPQPFGGGGGGGGGGCSQENAAVYIPSNPFSPPQSETRSHQMGRWVDGRWQMAGPPELNTDVGFGWTLVGTPVRCERGMHTGPPPR